MVASVYLSGDTGDSEHFARIGAPFEPFDMAFVKIGAHGPGALWLTSTSRSRTRGARASSTVNQVEQAAPHISEVADADRPFTSTPWYLMGRNAAK